MGDYRDMIRDNYPDRNGRETTVVFLVDGLSHAALTTEIRRNPRGTLASYFGIQPGNAVPSAFAVFPSETYPGISTLLTGLPVDQHGVSGNRIHVNGTEIDFEQPQPTRELEARLWDKTVFARLARENKIAVSLSYNFKTQSAVGLRPDIRAGWAYSRERYDQVDERTLRALEVLLFRAQPRHWPDFVFVHLVGLDGVAHAAGPGSIEAYRYLRWLDGALAPALSRMRQAEAEGHLVRSVLTADHGFETIRRTVDLRKAARFYLRKFDDYFVPVVAPRYVALHLKQPLPAAALHVAAQGIVRIPIFDGIAFREGDEIHYESRRARLKIAVRPAGCLSASYELNAFDLKNGRSLTGGFVCPELLESDNRGKLERLISLQLAAYFQAPGAPSAVLLAASGVSFTQGGLGQHGGLTPQELEVPLLIRNARLPSLPGASVALRRVLSDSEPSRAPVIASVALSGASNASLDHFIVRRHLALGLPSGLDWLAAAHQRWSSSFEPGIALEYFEKWSRRWGWMGRYQVAFASFRPDITERLTQQRFGVGPRYRIDDGFGAHVTIGAGQLLTAEAGSAGTRFPRLWAPEVTVGSPFRLLTLGIGDLQGLAELSALFPERSEGYARGVGYRKSFTLSFDQAVRTWDVLSWFTQLESSQFSYGSRQLSLLSLRFGVGYRIAL